MTPPLSPGPQGTFTYAGDDKGAPHTTFRFDGSARMYVHDDSVRFTPGALRMCTPLVLALLTYVCTCICLKNTRVRVRDDKKQFYAVVKRHCLLSSNLRRWQINARVQFMFVHCKMSEPPLARDRSASRAGVCF